MAGLCLSSILFVSTPQCDLWNVSAWNFICLVQLVTLYSFLTTFIVRRSKLWLSYLNLLVFINVILKCTYKNLQLIWSACYGIFHWFVQSVTLYSSWTTSAFSKGYHNCFCKFFLLVNIHKLWFWNGGYVTLNWFAQSVTLFSFSTTRIVKKINCFCQVFWPI